MPHHKFCYWPLNSTFLCHACPSEFRSGHPPRLSQGKRAEGRCDLGRCFKSQHVVCVSSPVAMQIHDVSTVTCSKSLGPQSDSNSLVVQSRHALYLTEMLGLFVTVAQRSLCRLAHPLLCNLSESAPALRTQEPAQMLRESTNEESRARAHSTRKIHGQVPGTP